MKIKWSQYQQTIFESIEPYHNMVIEAVAGSGKTTTIVEMIKLLKKKGLVSGNKRKGLVCAFNKHIEVTLSEKIKGTKFISKTLNAIGHGILVRHSYPQQIKIETKKYYQICEQVIDSFSPSYLFELNLKGLVNPEYKGKKNGVIGVGRLKTRRKSDYPYVFDELNDFVQVVNTCRKEYSKHFLSIEDLQNLMAEYPLEISDYLKKKELHQTIAVEAINKALDYGINSYVNDSTIDFSDQLWLPLTMGLTPITKYDWIIVDESQDLNLNQARLIKVLGHENSTYIFVGDSKQSIYLFNGAKPNCMKLIKRHFNCTEYPLSLCYRCPPNHITLAKEYNSQIEAFKEKDGLIEKSTITEIRDLVKQCYQTNTEIILISRLNYIFFEVLCQCAFIDRIKVSLLGKDLGAELVKLARLLLPDKFTDINKINKTLTSYTEYYSEQMDSSKADYCKCLLSIWQYIQPTNSDELNNLLNSVIIPQGVIKFGSIHRAKGTEADNVVILGDNLLPYSPTNRSLTDKETQQEENLTYVAFTRSKANLYLVPYINNNNTDDSEINPDYDNSYLGNDIDYGF